MDRDDEIKRARVDLREVLLDGIAVAPSEDAREALREILFDAHGERVPHRMRAILEAALEVALAFGYDAPATEEILREVVIFAAQQLGVRCTLS
jgi:hypothetical protein